MRIVQAGILQEFCLLLLCGLFCLCCLTDRQTAQGQSRSTIFCVMRTYLYHRLRLRQQALSSSLRQHAFLAARHTRHLMRVLLCAFLRRLFVCLILLTTQEANQEKPFGLRPKLCFSKIAFLSCHTFLLKEFLFLYLKSTP